MTGAQYWLKLKLPYQLENLTMEELTALRKLVSKAYNQGRKNAKS